MARNRKYVIHWSLDFQEDGSMILRGSRYPMRTYIELKAYAVEGVYHQGGRKRRHCYTEVGRVILMGSGQFIPCKLENKS